MIAAAAPLTMPSVVAAPVVTSMRRFRPVSLTTRSRSATGLKSTPNWLPVSAVQGLSSPAAAESAALNMATPVAAFSV